MYNILLGLVALLILGVVCLILVGVYEFALSIYRKIALQYRTSRGFGKVVGKEHDDNFALQLATKTYPLGLYDEFNVYVMFNGKKICFNDANAYNKVKVGDVVSINVHKGYDKAGVLKHEYYSIHV